MPPRGCQRKRSPRRQTRPTPHGLCRLRNLAGGGEGSHGTIRSRRPGVGATPAGRGRMTHSRTKQTGEGVADERVRGGRPAPRRGRRPGRARGLGEDSVPDPARRRRTGDEPAAVGTAVHAPARTGLPGVPAAAAVRGGVQHALAPLPQADPGDFPARHRPGVLHDLGRGLGRPRVHRHGLGTGGRRSSSARSSPRRTPSPRWPSPAGSACR